MQYISLTTQQLRNDFRSLLLILLFPLLVLGLTYAAIWASMMLFSLGMTEIQEINQVFLSVVPIVLGSILIWYLVAYFTNTSIIQKAVNAKPLDRKENMRVYNLVEKLCRSVGMQIPKVNVIEDRSLNAFASGLNYKSYNITLTRGIIDNLDDAELEGVIAHELAHIRNRDVRLLVISIVFVGITAMIAYYVGFKSKHLKRKKQQEEKTQFGFRDRLRHSDNLAAQRRMNAKSGSWRQDFGGDVAFILISAIRFFISIIGFFPSMLMRFAISQKREYLADAIAVEMTKKPLALASALRKISGNSNLRNKAPDNVAQLFIEHVPQKTAFSWIFDTHPPIEKRIAVLEQF